MYKWVLILFIQFIYIYAQSKLKPVTTLLNAKWPETSLLSETAEYLNDENPAFFWSYIDLVNKEDLKAFSKKNEKEKLDFSIKLAEIFLTEQQIKLLKFSLSLHVYSPKLEAFRQIGLDRGLKELEKCQSVIEIKEKLTCDIKEIEQLIKSSGQKYEAPVYNIDHIYPSSETNLTTVFLYGELGSEDFEYFHNFFKQKSDLISYVYRPYVKNTSEKQLRLSGYGVELQIKSTEYKAQDDTKLHEEADTQEENDESDKEVDGFVFSKLKELHPDHIDKLNALKSYFLESALEMAPLKVWQLQHLSMQATQRIMSAPEEERLAMFTNIAQNFPSVARSLIKTKVEERVLTEVLSNAATLRSSIDVAPTDAALFVNGVHFDLHYTDILTILEHVKSEQRLMQQLHSLTLGSDTLTELLSLDVGESKTDYGVDIRDSAIFWLNDVEIDKAYRYWPSSINELLKPTYPGMLRSIKKNIHNVVVVGDPTQRETASTFRLIETFLSHVSPLRLGVVFSVPADKRVTGKQSAAVAMLCAFNYIAQNEISDREKANQKAFQFILDVHSSVPSGDVSVSDVTALFSSRFKGEDIDDIFGEDSDYDVGRQLANMFIDKAGFKAFPQVLMNGVPLPEKQIALDDLEESILMEVMRTTQVMQRAVYRGDVADHTNVVDWLMEKPNIMPRLNERILSPKLSRSLDMSFSSTETLSDISLEDFSSLTAPQMTSVVAASCRYVAHKADSHNLLRPVTVWVVGDFAQTQASHVLYEAIKYTRESAGVRVCALSNTQSVTDISRAIHVAFASLPASIARQFLLRLLHPDAAPKVISGEMKIADFAVTGMDMEAFESRLSNFREDIVKAHSLYANKVMGLSRGRTSVVANGRMLGPLTASEDFTEEDFALLERFFMSSIGDKLVKILEESKLSSTPVTSDTVMRASSVLQSKSQIQSSQGRPRITLPSLQDKYSVIHLPPTDEDQPAFDLFAACDPASLAAQKVGPFLQVLRQVLNARVTLALNAIEKHSEMPLKSFYRYVVNSEPLVDSDNLGGPAARFTGLPESVILTQNYHVADNWLVEPVEAVHDLDNIKLDAIEGGVHSVFELEYLLLEGHCYEQSSGNPPRGLQFTLGTRQAPLLGDTIVMANLGYFQLKASPGAMKLGLREGRSNEIYSIVSHEGTETPSGTSSADELSVVVSSLRSHLVKVKVAKKAEKAHMDLLADGEDDDETNGGLWNTISSTFSKSENEVDDDEYINIFSVASGHLYERLLRIMMLSASKKSSKPVKFWIIKHFLSPNFKNSLPALSKQFSFSYELVQYKWPRWLHQQTEKQRSIWGYKILFLDVLFPLHVKKIIFVDADQVVRSDLKELVELDLEGAPYGFVPFCDSRQEMEGFRFWKQGYWRNHLGGRKYHISALFVVDLKKFRRIAAGDRLRGQYQGLSQDPNSLSNLDQDLPNNMIHQVRIRSLPMEWLWCETWCDNGSKEGAKVIDLCNNPLTKEAKLDAARRIIAEWPDYDEAIREVLRKGSTQNVSQKEVTEDQKKPHSEL